MLSDAAKRPARNELGNEKWCRCVATDIGRDRGVNMTKKRPFSLNATKAKPSASEARLAERLGQEEPSIAIFARRLPELLALRSDELLPVNVAVRAAVSRVVGSAKRLKTLRPRIEATFRVFDFAQFDGLEDYAWAFNHTHTLLMGTARVPRCPPALLDEAAALQRVLKSDCRALIDRGLLRKSRLKHLQRGKGIQILGNNLNILSSVLRDSWPAIASRCGITEADLKRADQIAYRLVSIGDRRERQPEEIVKAKELRARAFTLMMRAYHHARSTALYLLDSEAAVAKVAPAITAGRKRARKTSPASMTVTDHASKGSTVA